MWRIYCITLILLIGHIDIIRSQLSRNEITHSVYDANKERSWMDTAKDALAGPAGKMAVHLAKEIISRSTGNSQVMSLYTLTVDCGSGSLKKLINVLIVILQIDVL